MGKRKVRATAITTARDKSLRGPRVIAWIEINSPVRTLSELRTVIRARPLTHSYSVGEMRPPRRDPNKLTAYRIAETTSAKGALEQCVTKSLARAKPASWRKRLRDDESVRVVVGMFYRTADLTIRLSPSTMKQLADYNIGCDISAYACED